MTFALYVEATMGRFWRLAATAETIQPGLTGWQQHMTERGRRAVIVPVATEPAPRELWDADQHAVSLEVQP
jgi:hypothetical protein